MKKISDTDLASMLESGLPNQEQLEELVRGYKVNKKYEQQKSKRIKKVGETKPKRSELDKG